MLSVCKIYIESAVIPVYSGCRQCKHVFFIICIEENRGIVAHLYTIGFCAFYRIIRVNITSSDDPSVILILILRYRLDRISRSADPGFQFAAVIQDSGRFEFALDTEFLFGSDDEKQILLHDLCAVLQIRRVYNNTV